MAAQKRKPGRLLPGEKPILWAEVEELGLEEAPEDIGLSVEELEDIERRRADR
jgi:hypothetical protein